MIPAASRHQIASELSALGGSSKQIERIGEILFTASVLDAARDAEYLLEQMSDDDSLIRRACRIMLDGIAS